MVEKESVKKTKFEIMNEKIQLALEVEPKTINQIADSDDDLNWKTVETYINNLKILNLVIEIPNSKPKRYIKKDSNNFFNLPVKSKDKITIESLYFKIREFCKDIYFKEPTKTHMYKIIWKFQNKFSDKYQLPIGWFQFGPCPVVPYEEKDIEPITFEKDELKFLKNTVEEFCKLDNIELQTKIYEEESELYKIKNKLRYEKIESENKTINHLKEFLNLSPKESQDTIERFIRLTSKIGWNKTKLIFDELWKYIALLEYKESLKDYYKETIYYLLDSKIEVRKTDALMSIESFED